jgi:hypothetical protein
MKIRPKRHTGFEQATEECIGIDMSGPEARFRVIVEKHGNLGNIKHYDVFIERFQEWVDLEKATKIGTGLFVYKEEGNLIKFREPKNFEEFTTGKWID